MLSYNVGISVWTDEKKDTMTPKKKKHKTSIFPLTISPDTIKDKHATKYLRPNLCYWKEFGLKIKKKQQKQTQNLAEWLTTHISF